MIIFFAHLQMCNLSLKNLPGSSTNYGFTCRCSLDSNLPTGFYGITQLNPPGI